MQDDSTPVSTCTNGDDQSGDLDVLRAQIVALEAEVKKFRDLAARAQAELQNAKARSEKEAADMRMFASESLIRRLLPTLDNFQRAFAHMPDELKTHEWVKGLYAVEQELLKQLEAVGLQRMQSMGAAVDPQYHEVLMTGESEDPSQVGTVIAVFEEGYLLGPRVLRVAKVEQGMPKQG